jgi:transcriptional repressor NrdR
MKCIFCGKTESKVIDSRTSDDSLTIRRRRECLACQKRWTTYETMEVTPILVIKGNGNREAWSPEKVKKGIIKSCEKRPVTAAQIDNMILNIEKQIYNQLTQEIDSKVIGEMVMDELKLVDEIAYIRFASVYRKFKDVSHFAKFLNDFEKIVKN